MATKFRSAIVDGLVVFGNFHHEVTAPNFKGAPLVVRAVNGGKLHGTFPGNGAGGAFCNQRMRTAPLRVERPLKVTAGYFCERCFGPESAAALVATIGGAK